MMRNPGPLPTDLPSLFHQIQSPSLMPRDVTEHQLQPSFSPCPHLLWITQSIPSYPASPNSAILSQPPHPAPTTLV